MLAKTTVLVPNLRTVAISENGGAPAFIGLVARGGGRGEGVRGEEGKGGGVFALCANLGSVSNTHNSTKSGTRYRLE